GQLVRTDRRCSVTIAAIGPGRGTPYLRRDESRRMNLNGYVVYRCRRFGPLHQRHPGRSRSLGRHDDCFHRAMTRDLDDALRETPNATLYILPDDLRRVLIHDRADREAIA